MVKTYAKQCAACYIGGKPKGPVTQKHLRFSVINPQRQAGFCHAQILGDCSIAIAIWLRGMVGAIRKDARTAEPVFLTAMLHQLHSKMHPVVSRTRSGIQTMTATTTAHSASTPTTGTSDPIQLHAQAHNALNMACYYLRQPQANTAAARRKAVQALAALRGLSLALEG